MKLPRDVSGASLAQGLAQFGYQITRQTGSHIRLTLDALPQHHLTIPAHDTLKAGTLSAILSLAAQRLGISRQELLSKMKL